MNINEATVEVEVGTDNFTNTIQQVLINGNLFFLPRLFMRKTHSKELLIDYF